MAATSTGESIFARARTIASQTANDATMSAIIDSKGGLRALLNHSIREVYRRKSGDQKFIKDTVTRAVVSVSSGTGAVPENLMREFLHQANIEDNQTPSSLITYFNYAVDANSGQTFGQLGYVWIEGDDFKYLAPTPTLANYTGNLFVTCASFPEFPASMSDEIILPSAATIDDVVLFLSMAIAGKEGYEIVTA